MGTGYNNKEDIPFSSSETNYIIPISIDAIRKSLQINGKETLISCLEDIGLFNDYRNCRNNIMCSESFFIDPNKYYLPDKLENPNDPTNIQNGYYVKSINYDKLNEYLQHIKDINITSLPSIKYITGARGIGKTLTMNMLLVRNFDFLCRNKIIFVRCDIKKFLDLKLQERDKDDFTIANYMDCQFLYILCEQLALPFYQKIKEILNGKIFDYRESKDGTAKELRNKPLNIGELLEQYGKIVIQHKHNYPKNRDKNYARAVIMSSRVCSRPDSSTRAYDNWIMLSQQIQEILQQKGYKLWAIIDGIDNVPKLDKDDNLDKRFKIVLNAAAKFEGERGKECFIWFLMRNNTFQMFKNEIKILFDRFIDETEQHKFKIKCVPKETIIDERIRVFELERKYLKKLNLNSIKPIPFNEKLIILSNHIRNFIDNWITVLFWHPVNRNENAKIDENFYFSTLLLNQRLFLDTQNTELQNSQNTDVLFNIFYYNAYRLRRSKLEIWHGWCATRIMQLVENRTTLDKAEGITKEELVDTLAKSFSYDKKQVEITYNNLKNYGFIRHNDKDLQIVITEEGKTLIHFMFSRLELLYYCALDTPMPDFCISKDNKEGYITAHNNNPGVRDFGKHCINTATTFLSFLDFQHKEEMKRLKTKKKSALMQIFKNPLDDLHISEKISERIKDLDDKRKTQVSTKKN